MPQSVITKAGLLLSHIRSLIGVKKLAETSRPTRWRSKTNRGLITRAFPCCASSVSMFSTTLCDSNLFFWLTLVSVVIFFKRPSTGKHSLTIWEYFLTGVEVREKKGSNYSEQGTKVENTQMSEPNGCFMFRCLLCFRCCCFQWLSVRAHLLSGWQLPCLFIVTFHWSWRLLWVSRNQT